MDGWCVWKISFMFSAQVIPFSGKFGISCKNISSWILASSAGLVCDASSLEHFLRFCPKPCLLTNSYLFKVKWHLIAEVFITGDSGICSLSVAVMSSAFDASAASTGESGKLAISSSTYWLKEKSTFSTQLPGHQRLRSFLCYQHCLTGHDDE